MRPYFRDYQLIMCGKLLRNLLCNVSHDGVAKPLLWDRLLGQFSACNLLRCRGVEDVSHEFFHLNFL
jgi:hypothetical protein